MRVLIIDEVRADAVLLATMLHGSPRWRFTCDIGHPDDLLDRAWRQPRYDVIVVGGPTRQGELVRRVRVAAAASPATPVVACCYVLDDQTAVDLAKAGAYSVVDRSEWTAATTALTVGYAVMSATRSRLSARDPLTGLLTRATWNDRLQHAIERCTRTKLPCAVLLLDVDDFKSVNDTVGHDGGDRYLVEVSRRIRGAVREQDSVARLGGDEFGLLVEDLAYPEAALQVAAKVLAAIGDDVRVDRSTMALSASIGVVIVTPEQRLASPDWVQKAADFAVYESKRLGKNRFSLYTDDMDREILDAIRFDDEVVRATQHNEFSLHYQPIIDLRSGQLEGFEALLRWTHGRRPGVSPSTFVPTLERVGLMGQVGRAVFVEAIMRLGGWRARTGCDLSMHINLSASQLADGEVIVAIQSAIDEAKVDPSQIVVELTESLLFKHSDLFTKAWRKLRERGVRVAIDDFGTGFNSLVNLKRFHPEVIKIDRDFVGQIGSSTPDAAIVRAQLTLAEHLEITSVAEGVERDEHLVVLQRLGDVDQAQGFLLGKPMSASEVEGNYRPLSRLIRTIPLWSSGREDLRESRDGRLPTAGAAHSR